MTEIKLDNGKYTFVFEYNGTPIRCLRYGELWREFEVGDNALFALCHHAAELEEERESLRMYISKLDTRLEKLDALEASGVDNWSGYDDAIREMRKNAPDKDE